MAFYKLKYYVNALLQTPVYISPGAHEVHEAQEKYVIKARISTSKQLERAYGLHYNNHKILKGKQRLKTAEKC